MVWREGRGNQYEVSQSLDLKSAENINCETDMEKDPNLSWVGKFCALRSSPALASLARPIKPNFFQALVTIKKRSRHFATTCTSRQDDIMKTTIVPEIVPNKLPIENANSKQGNLNRLIGTLYEIHSIKCMKEILFMKDLVHIGKRGSQDGGIDIRGWLYSNQETATQSCLSQDRQGNADKPDQAQQSDNADHTKQERFIRVIAQCKCSRGELKIVRELEGLVGSSPTHTNSSTLKPTLGLLFASRGFCQSSGSGPPVESSDMSSASPPMPAMTTDPEPTAIHTTPRK
ncbi:hypothetical protein PtB15_13B18 [Puccinia triticina]|nr:hypothetical protein PtB15_13B18 [Puccinia triticina]